MKALRTWLIGPSVPVILTVLNCLNRAMVPVLRDSKIAFR